MAASILSITLWVLAALHSSNARKSPGSYAPKTNQQCPQTLLRQPHALNQTLNPSEASYLAERRKLFPDAWRDWLGDGSKLGYDLGKLGMTADNGSGLPVIGIAASGGGYRASQYGAGVISGLDARDTTANGKGTGGLLQVSSYLAGLSGGSWLISSMLFHDFPEMHDLVMGNTEKGGTLNGWFLDRGLVLPYGIDPFNKNNQLFWGSLLWSVKDKGRMGLDTSMTDIWARALSYHFLSGLGSLDTMDTITTSNNFFTNDTSHGAGILWSDMKSIPTFQKHEFPLPIVVANVRPPGFSKLPPDTVLFLNSTQYEFTPWEMGSYDPDLSAFVDVKFLGTSLNNGKPLNSSACVTEFDQTSFVFGTSSSLFDRFLSLVEEKVDVFDTDNSNALLELLKRMLNAVATRADDVANYPNPFQGINPGIFQDSDSEWIELVDGSTNKENIPIGPLLVKARNVDVIVAIDAGAEDANDWPLGRSIFATRNRTQDVTAPVSQKFPPVPDNLSDFNRLGLNRRSTFFGCDPKQNPPEFPLIVWIPNAPPSDGSNPVTNSGTFKLTYATWHTEQFLSQARATASDGFLDGQLGPDPEYGTCLQCAAIDRARLKTKPVTPRSDICSNCFKKYCYDPENPPSEGQIVGRRFKFKDPDPFGMKSFYLAHKTGVIIAAIIVGLGLIATITGCVMFWWRRFQRRKTRAVAYQRLSRGDGSEWSAHMRQESYDVTPPRYSVLDYEEAEWRHSGPSHEMAKAHYAELSYQLAEKYHAGSGYETAKLHYEEPSYEAPMATADYAGSSDETAKLHHAEPSYETATADYAAPGYTPEKPHHEESSYETVTTHFAAPNYPPGKLHHEEPSYETATTHYAAPGYTPEKPHHEESSHETVTTHYAAPNYPPGKLHHEEPSYETATTHYTEPNYYSERRD